jgi:hypothetical protein
MAATPTYGEPKRRPLWTGYLMLAGCFAGLCALLSLAVTIYEALQENRQSHWPETAAAIQQCGVERQTTDNADYYVIDCRIGSVISGRTVTSHVRSHSLRAPEKLIWEYHPGQAQRMLDSMEAWVEAHPPGTPINVHYNPSSHGQSALVMSDMPNSGSRTPWNLELTGGLAAICAALLTLGTIALRLPVR